MSQLAGSPQPLYLYGSGPPTFAVLHPAAGRARRTAVLMCPPFGWEDMCCYRIRRDWAQGLADDGYTTLRIDLPGSGDSAGAPGDPGQLDTWTNAVAEAARWLLQPAKSTGENGWQDEARAGGASAATDAIHAGGAERVAAIGIGLGGLVACRAALLGAPIDELALWAVPAKGKRLLRELRAFSAFEVANNPAEEADRQDGTDADRGPEDGALVTNGYAMSAETVAALERLDLTELASAPAGRQPAPAGQRPSPTGPRLARALVLGRDGMKVSGELPDLLCGVGAEVQVADGPGYGAMMQEPQDARTPVETIELVGRWLAEGESEEAVAGNRITSPAAAGRPAPEARDELVMECDRVAVRERPVLLDGPDGPLFAILSEPVGERGELTAVLLNAGPQRRVGPNRMWVEIARRWAAQGVPALRLDCAGIGDSDGDPKVLARVTEFYRPAYAEQAQAAIRALAGMGLGQRFVMVGLCAGGYWSVQTALADERVARVIMLNPRTLVFDEWRHARRRTRDLREKALRPATWGKVLRGDIKLAKHLETGRALAGRAAGAPARARHRFATLRTRAGSAVGGTRAGSAVDGTRAGSAVDGTQDGLAVGGTRAGSATRGTQDGLVASGRVAPEPAGQDPIEALFDALRDRGQRGLLLFTGKEVLRRELTEKGVLERMERWPNLELVIGGTSADTHTLTPVWLQRQVHELVDRLLVQEMELVGGDRAGADGSPSATR